MPFKGTNFHVVSFESTDYRDVGARAAFFRMLIPYLLGRALLSRLLREIAENCRPVRIEV